MFLVLFAIYKNMFVNTDENNSKDLKKIPFNELASIQRGFSYKGTEKSNDKTHHVFITLNNIGMNGGFKTEYSRINSSRLKERSSFKKN